MPQDKFASGIFALRHELLTKIDKLNSPVTSRLSRSLSFSTIQTCRPYPMTAITTIKSHTAIITHTSPTSQGFEETSLIKLTSYACCIALPFLTPKQSSSDNNESGFIHAATNRPQWRAEPHRELLAMIKLHHHPSPPLPGAHFEVHRNDQHARLVVRVEILMRRMRLP